MNSDDSDSDPSDAENLLTEHELHKPSLDVGFEYGVSTTTKLTCLAAYFTANLTLTIYNKAVLGPFPLPFLLTFLHTTVAFLGCLLLFCTGRLKLSRLGRKENVIVSAFSCLFTLNIAISNASLEAVSIPFHQVARSSVPLFTVFIYRAFLSRSYSAPTYWSLIPIVLGVAIATYGDIEVSLYGGLITFFGVALAAIKTVLTNRILTGRMSVPAMELLFRMSPLASLQALAYAFATQEHAKVAGLISKREFSLVFILLLFFNGLLAFLLNVASFRANELAGALTQTVAGNIKQCLTIVLGSLIFHTIITPLHATGILITLGGSAWYSHVELLIKKS